jgi:Rad3-related DNA helicase
MDDDDPIHRAWGARWYAWKTAQISVQGFGRICRDYDDFGVTYLLDGGFEDVLRSGYLPDYVLEAVR